MIDVQKMYDKMWNRVFNRINEKDKVFESDEYKRWKAMSETPDPNHMIFDHTYEKSSIEPIEIHGEIELYHEDNTVTSISAILRQVNKDKNMHNRDYTDIIVYNDKEYLPKSVIMEEVSTILREELTKLREKYEVKVCDKHTDIKANRVIPTVPKEERCQMDEGKSQKPIPNCLHIKGTGWEVTIVHKEFEDCTDGLLMWYNAQGYIPIETDNSYIEDQIKMKEGGIRYCTKANFENVIELLIQDKSCYSWQEIPPDPSVEVVSLTYYNS